MDETQVHSTRMPAARRRELLARARSEPAAFGALYDFYLPRIYGFIYRRLGERAEAEAVTAAAFQHTLEAVRRGELGKGSVGSWLYRAAERAIVEHRRAARCMAPGAHAGVDLAFELFTAAVDDDRLRQALRGLPDHHRRVLLLRYLDDLELDEACAVLGCSPRSFATRLASALSAVSRGGPGREPDAIDAA